jgi:hypothetical protein
LCIGVGQISGDTTRYDHIHQLAVAKRLLVEPQYVFL